MDSLLPDGRCDLDGHQHGALQSEPLRRHALVAIALIVADMQTNCFDEDVALFREMARNQFLINKPMVLALNQIDRLPALAARVPFVHDGETYRDPQTILQTMQRVLLQGHEDRVRRGMLHVVYTCARNEESVLNLVRSGLSAYDAATSGAARFAEHPRVIAIRSSFPDVCARACTAVLTISSRSRNYR
jgi:hypothetical protein